MYKCDKCHQEFAKSQGLQRHLARKRPCITIPDAAQVATQVATRCDRCGNVFSRADSLRRHKQKHCAAPVADGTRQEIDELRARLARLENQPNSITVNAPVTNTVTNVSGPVTNVSGPVTNVSGPVTNVVNNVSVKIAPWGSPLQLTDADVEAALATVPGLAGTPALPEVVAALMELVKRAHMPPAARNVHLNPKRTDQALALTSGGWAAMPLEEATVALFDGASASMAAARMPSVRQMMRTTIPVQYRAERAASVQLGLRPMGAHLLNVAPGGPGPLLLTGPAEPAGAGTGAGAQQSAASTHETFDAARACELLKNHPAVAGVTAEWLTRVTAAAGISAMGLARALRQASAAGLCGMAEWQGILRLQRDSQVPARGGLQFTSKNCPLMFD